MNDTDILTMNDIKHGYKELGYAVVEQAFIDYKKYLEFVKQNKSMAYIKKMKSTPNMIKKYQKQLQKYQIQYSNKNELVNKLKKIILKKLIITLADIKQVNEFIMSEWFSTLCPIVDKSHVKQRLEELEQEILGKETYLVKNINAKIKTYKALLNVYKKKEGKWQ